MTELGIATRPIVETLYGPYRAQIVAYDYGVSLADAERALDALERNNPPPGPEEAEDCLAYLLANTKRRSYHEAQEALYVAGLRDVAMEYPARYVQSVVRFWHRREGDEAIFSPSQAEFYRALEEAAAPYKVLVAQLRSSRTSLRAADQNDLTDD